MQVNKLIYQAGDDESLGEAARQATIYGCDRILKGDDYYLVLLQVKQLKDNNNNDNIQLDEEDAGVYSESQSSSIPE